MRDSLHNKATMQPPKRYIVQGRFQAEIQDNGRAFRFVIRDSRREQPSIHGERKNLEETESEVAAVLDRLCSQVAA